MENANRTASAGLITFDNLELNPKNPIIAAFFRNIGYANQLDPTKVGLPKKSNAGYILWKSD